MKKGIKRRLVWSYLLLIMITVALFEGLILFALHSYYVEGVKQALRDEGTIFSSFYEKEILDGTFDRQASPLLQDYHFFVNAHVQLVNTAGEIIASTASLPLEHDGDIATALNGATGYYSGTLNDEEILTVSQPLLIHDNVYGAIRFTTSMEEVNRVFKQNSYSLIGVGLIVMLVAFSVSYILANTITKPVGIITEAAEEMAAGKFSTRITNKNHDELGKLADTLNYMAEQVEKHERLKNEFIASVSHELRTPLTSVQGWAITLHSMTEDKMFKEGLEIISSESERLSLLLSDLLDLSSLSSGKVEFQFEELSLKSLLEQVITQLKPRADRQGIELLRHDKTDVYIKGDFNRLKQVFINVLDNSLKFTPEGGKISIFLETVDQTVFIRIKDTGAGIPPEELDLVKEKFHKGKSKASGTGLGLAICQEIIQAHEGSFDLMSTIGAGTTVEIQLPVN